MIAKITDVCYDEMNMEIRSLYYRGSQPPIMGEPRVPPLNPSETIVLSPGRGPVPVSGSICTGPRKNKLVISVLFII